MRAGLQFDLVFPIQDELSARLMLHKAECLLAAGVITEAETTAALERANPILAKFAIAR
jgi:hypothetical protein